ncbi:MAG: endonuclease [Rhodocyclales bacterium]|nr:endonuclease [Rhodocyclales bacterium]
MPEGPSIVILKEQAQSFAGKKIVSVSGNTRLDKERLVDQKVIALRSWGKHFLIELRDFSVRIHFMLFGTYQINPHINERKNAAPRLGLAFKEGELNFYACSVQFVEGKLDDTYDWSGDVMSDEWDADAALKKLRAMPDALVCDALLDQNVFAGVGNIIKNEVLFRIRVHPLSTIGGLPATKLRELVEQARQYSFEFLEWKKAFVLKQHWLAHTKSTCPRCHIPFSKGQLGKTKRRSFYCERCQKQYAADHSLQGSLFEKPPARRSRKSAAQAA